MYSSGAGARARARGDCPGGRRGEARGEVAGGGGGGGSCAAVTNGLLCGHARRHWSGAIEPHLGIPLGRGTS